MDSGIYKILTELFVTDSYLTYQYLSLLLKVSVRSVNRLIPQVTDYLQDNDIPFEILRGKGIRLLLKPPQRQQHLRKLQNTSAYWSDEERVLLISIELLEAGDYIKSDYFCNRYLVSATLLKKDLKRVEENAKPHKLKLLRERGSGIQLYGEALAKKRFLIAILLEQMDFAKVDVLDTAPFQEDIFRKGLSASVREKLVQLCRLPALNRLHTVLQSFDPQLAHRLVIENYSRLVLLLAYLDRRDKQQEAACYTAENGYISRMLAAVLGSEGWVGQKEYAYLKAFYESSRQIQYDQAEVSQGQIKEKILADLYTEFGSRMERSKMQSDMLDYHLDLFIRRYYSEITATNQLVDKIKQEYPEVFARVRQILLNHGFSEVVDDEITFIAMHILGAMLEHKNKRGQVKLALVCMSGFGTSKMLKETLRTHFPGAMISKITTLADLDELGLIKEGIGVIVSTVKLQTTFLPVIMVEPILRQQDIERIRRVMGQQQKNKQPEEETQGHSDRLEQVLEGMLCQAAISYTDMEAVIRYVSRCICPDDERARMLHTEFMRREKYGSAVLPGGVLLLHTKFQDVVSFGVFSLAAQLPYRTLEAPVQINRVISMVIPSDAETAVVDLFSQISVALIKQPALMDAIKSMDRRKIITTMENLMNLRNEKYDTGKKQHKA